VPSANASYTRRAERLAIVIKGDGAFRRFKDIARSPGELERSPSPVRSTSSIDSPPASSRR